MADKETRNFVSQDAFHVETVKKELRLQKLPTDFTINPFKKLHVLPDKPMSKKPPEDIAADSDLIETINRAYMEPSKKYSAPQTESQEVGWMSKPLIQDTWFSFRRVASDVTRHAEHAWKHQMKPF